MIRRPRARSATPVLACLFVAAALGGGPARAADPAAFEDLRQGDRVRMVLTHGGDLVGHVTAWVGQVLSVRDGEQLLVPVDPVVVRELEVLERISSRPLARVDAPEPDSEEEQRELRRRRARAGALATGSFFIPGLGQYAAGKPGLPWIWLEVLRASRRNEEAKQLALGQAAKLVAEPSRGDFGLAQHLHHKVDGQLQHIERFELRMWSIKSANHSVDHLVDSTMIWALKHELLHAEAVALGSLVSCSLYGGLWFDQTKAMYDAIGTRYRPADIGCTWDQVRQTLAKITAHIALMGSDFRVWLHECELDDATFDAMVARVEAD